jgi:hypothetical protein
MSRPVSHTQKKALGLWPLSLLLFSLSAQAGTVSGSFTAVTYNVAGLPQDLSCCDPNTHIPLIAANLNAESWDIVALQEAFVHGQSTGQVPGIFGAVGPLDYNQLMGVFTPTQFSFPPADAATTTVRVASGLGRRSLLPLSSTTLPLLACEDASNDPTKYCRQRFDLLVDNDANSDKGYSFSQHTLAPGVLVAVYHWRAQAGELNFAERADNTRQLINEINTRSEGKAVIVLGDSNSTYDQTNDVIREMLTNTTGTGGQDAPLKDAWNELMRGGLGLPVQGGTQLFPCDPEDPPDPAERPRNDWAGPNCEWRDKTFYRSSAALTLTATQYFVETDYRDPMMGPDFSDHYPTGVVFNYEEVPEPASSLLALAALSALGVLRVKRSRGRTR